MIVVRPAKLNGRIHARPSKSVLHRSIICASLAEGESSIKNFSRSEDICATLGALESMGLCDYEVKGGTCFLKGGLEKSAQKEIYCGESGSTLRFLLPLACDGKPYAFTGRGRLMERPLAPYEKIFAENGVKYKKADDRIDICGRLSPGVFELPGNVSSQFVSGLLFKLPLLAGGSGIGVTTKLESRPYIDLTRQSLDRFGVVTSCGENSFITDGNQKYSRRDIYAEGRLLPRGFFCCCGGDERRGNYQRAGQGFFAGDKEIFNILKCFGAVTSRDGDSVTVSQGELKPIELNVSDIPDLVPVISVLACAAEGRTVIKGAGR
jgi:3-phosphoshikimate 1-carboxyvinyltransferase